MDCAVKMIDKTCIIKLDFSIIVMKVVMNVKYDGDCGHLLMTQQLPTCYGKFACLMKEVLMWTQL